MKIVHAIVAQSKVKGSVEVTARCGLVNRRPASVRLPDDFTVWESLVTCESCEGAR